MTAYKPDFSTIPESPGIYLMKNTEGKIIYIGKAKNLRNRVRSYFQSKGNLTYKTAVLVGKIADIETVETSSEIEALITESNYVKKYLPRYNILLKDGKHIPFIQVTMDELYPRLRIVRRVKNDRNAYFGPYTSGGQIKAIIRSIYKLFPVRQSNDILDGEKTRRPCLNYQMKQCLAPCAGHISPEDYGTIIKEVVLFLKGKYKELIAKLEEEMFRESRKHHFERAAEYRDRIEMVKKHLEAQAVYSTSLETRDAVGLYIKEDISIVQILSFFSGKLSGNRNFIIQDFSSNEPGDLLSEALSRFYFGKTNIPGEILIPFDFEDREMLETLFSEQAGKKVRLVAPERGLRKKMMFLAEKNAKSLYENKITDSEKLQKELKGIQKLLKLKNLPKLIEGFDISNIGETITASHVSFANLKPDKKLYRNYKMKWSLEPEEKSPRTGLEMTKKYKQDDYLSMREVVSRRMRRVLEDALPIPDLLVIDGGKGHVGVVETLLRDEYPGIYEQIDIIGIAKGGSHSKIVTDEMVLTNGDVIDAREHTEILRPLLLVRDEVHRAAITFLRGVTRKQNLLSELDEINGVGEKRKVLLLKTFGSLENIKKQHPETLHEKCKIPLDLAQRIVAS